MRNAAVGEAGGPWYDGASGSGAGMSGSGSGAGASGSAWAAAGGSTSNALATCTVVDAPPAFSDVITMSVSPVTPANSTSAWTRYLYAAPGTRVIATSASAMRPPGSTVLTAPSLNRMSV